MPSLIPLLLATLLATAGPHASPPAATLKLPYPGTWADRVEHPYFPLVPGTVWIYATRDARHVGVDSVEVLTSTRRILGASATEVRDRTYMGTQLIEDSLDWYAQDENGNVWYLGEDTKTIKRGRVVSTAGSWEAGRDGAQPGIVMWARPQLGGAYRQEFRRGVAEDMARVLGTDATVEAGGVSYPRCVQIEEWSPLEPGVREQKFYEQGVGLVRMITTAGPHEEQMLLRVVTR